jgi:hypothetical protein
VAFVCGSVVKRPLGCLTERHHDLTTTRLSRADASGPIVTLEAAVDFAAARLSERGPSLEKEDAMKFMLLIHQGTTPTPNDPEAWAQLSPEQQKAVYADYMAINETAGVTPADAQMQPPEMASTVRVQDGRTLTTDGPFVEMKEALGGYLFYEADDLDAAIELAARIPAARMGGAIEVRPMVER